MAAIAGVSYSTPPPPAPPTWRYQGMSWQDADAQARTFPAAAIASYWTSRPALLAAARLQGSQIVLPLPPFGIHLPGKDAGSIPDGTPWEDIPVGAMFEDIPTPWDSEFRSYSTKTGPASISSTPYRVVHGGGGIEGFVAHLAAEIPAASTIFLPGVGTALAAAESGALGSGVQAAASSAYSNMEHHPIQTAGLLAAGAAAPFVAPAIGSGLASLGPLGASLSGAAVAAGASAAGLAPKPKPAATPAATATTPAEATIAGLPAPVAIGAGVLLLLLVAR
jgi:hypothetical protein